MLYLLGMMPDAAYLSELLDLVKVVLDNGGMVVSEETVELCL